MLSMMSAVDVVTGGARKRRRSASSSKDDNDKAKFIRERMKMAFRRSVNTPSESTRDIAGLEPDQSALLTINVGGKTSSFLIDKLLTMPESRLGMIANAYVKLDMDGIQGACDFFTKATGKFKPGIIYFDRSPDMFAFVEEIHRHGTSYTSRHMNPILVDREAQYWKISADDNGFGMVDKSTSTRSPGKDNKVIVRGSSVVGMVPGASIILNDTHRKDDQTKDKRSKAMLRKIKTIPNKIIQYATAVFALIAVSLQTFATLEALDIKQCDTNNTNATDALHHLSKMRHSHWMLILGGPIMEAVSACPIVMVHQAFVYMQLVCLAWFIVYYFFSLLRSPSKCRYMKSLEGVTLLLVIVPTCLELIVSAVVHAHGLHNFHHDSGIFVVIHILRVLRVLRVLLVIHVLLQMRLTRRMLKALVRASKELGLFALFVLALAVLCSSIIFEVESGVKGTKFTSIPQTCWWAIVTLTTVGYGDMAPTSVIGQAVSSVIIMLSLICLALPLTIVMNKVQDMYTTEKIKDGEKSDDDDNKHSETA